MTTGYHHKTLKNNFEMKTKNWPVQNMNLGEAEIHVLNGNGFFSQQNVWRIMQEYLCRERSLPFRFQGSLYKKRCRLQIHQVSGSWKRAAFLCYLAAGAGAWSGAAGATGITILLAGAFEAGAAPGATGIVWPTGAGLEVMTLLEGLWSAKNPKVNEVSMNTTTNTRVALFMKSTGPELPNKAWPPAPPKTAPMSAPLPACRSTATIRQIHAKTWIVIRSAYIFLPSISNYSLEGSHIEACASDECPVDICLSHKNINVVGLHAPTVQDAYAPRNLRAEQVFHL
jgi:hypothetical protein